MDLVADMLVERLGRQGRDVEALRLQPAFRRRATAIPLLGRAAAAFTFDRFTNRLFDYPRWLRGKRDEADVFHLADHSYAHLAHELPAERTVVTCHDLDTFRSVLDPRSERRSAPFRRMTERILGGLQKAARVTCDSTATHDAIVAAGLLSPDRLNIVPNGVHPDFTPEPVAEADRALEELLGPAAPGSTELLHIGSTIPRKNVETLLRVFAGVRRRNPHARLLRVGGPMTPAQRRLAVILGILDDVVELPSLSRPVVAAVCRRSQMLRETGGHAAIYCEPDRVEEWVDVICTLSGERDRSPDLFEVRRRRGFEHAARFSWDAYASRMIDIYDEIAGRAS
jgi:glycosyltransferase involved in cell wall biosynthesis